MNHSNRQELTTLFANDEELLLLFDGSHRKYKQGLNMINNSRMNDYNVSLR